jgi:hypothetical protein
MYFQLSSPSAHVTRENTLMHVPAGRLVSGIACSPNPLGDVASKLPLEKPGEKPGEKPRAKVKGVAE